MELFSNVFILLFPKFLFSLFVPIVWLLESLISKFNSFKFSSSLFESEFFFNFLFLLRPLETLSIGFNSLFPSNIFRIVNLLYTSFLGVGDSFISFTFFSFSFSLSSILSLVVSRINSWIFKLSSSCVSFISEVLISKKLIFFFWTEFFILYKITTLFDTSLLITSLNSSSLMYKFNLVWK